MADITKCMNTQCPSAKTCYRVTAPANPYRQSWDYFNYSRSTGKCEHYAKSTKKEVN